MESDRITVDELRRRLAAGERPVMVDARSEDAWSRAESQVPGSIRVPPDEVATHLREIPRGRPVVAYCT